MCIVIDLDVVCLVCLHHSQEMHTIFAPDSDTPDLQIAHKISTLSKLKVSVDNESLPDKICETCLEDLRVAWRFHKNCQTAAVVFQSIFRPKQAKTSPRAQTSHVKDEVEYDTEPSFQEEPAGNDDKLAVEANSNGSVIEDPENDATLDNSQNLEIPTEEECAEPEDPKEQNTEFYDMNQSIVQEDYLSVPETADEEIDLVEYYIAEEDISKRPSTSKDMEKVQIGEASSSRQSLLRNRNEENTLPPLQYKKQHQQHTQPENVRLRESGAFSKSQQTLKVRKTYTQQRQHHNSEVDEDFEPMPKSKAAVKRKLPSEVKAPKICELCGNSYRFQHALNAHMRRHFQDKPYPCELCDKAFVSNVELRRHMRVHTGHKPYGCQYCDRHFSDFGSRVKHERTHTGERPYKCGTCSKSFAYPHVLSVHLRTHTGEKRFQCELCTKGFTKKAYLISHMDQYHSGRESSKVKRRDAGHTSTCELSMDGTISEAGEENEFQEIKSDNFDDCMYTAELASEGDAVSQQENDEEAGDEDTQQDVVEDDDDANQILIEETLMHSQQGEEDNDNSNDEVVEVQIDDYTIRVR